ncbi:MAG: hypothetical protein JO086_00175 [Acidimicrobiia bacterium]|nr:hypothetical protein [Acidimicrobiia bacterium]
MIAPRWRRGDKLWLVGGTVLVGPFTFVQRARPDPLEPGRDLATLRNPRGETGRYSIAMFLSHADALEKLRRRRWLRRRPRAAQRRQTANPVARARRRVSK